MAGKIIYFIISIFYCLLLTVFITGNSLANILFEDGFESKNMSKTNTDGFSWGGNNATSIVTMNPTCGPPPGTATEIFNNGAICNSYPGEDWRAMTGDNSLRFRYAAGGPMSEQRFALGTAYPDLWIRYWLRVPVNYSHTPGLGSNNKFLSLWSESYTALTSARVAWEMRPIESTGGSVIYFKYNHPDSIVGGDNQYTPFISVPADRGRWMQVVLHVKIASAVNASDGVIELYRRWDGESMFTRIHGSDTINVYPTSGPMGFSFGYLMGWANGAYAADTEWLIDDVTFSTTDLREVGAASRRLSLAGSLIKIVEPGP